MMYHQIIGNGKPLVLIHGFGFCGEIFTQLIEKYKHQYQITIIDLPGHGKSSDLVGIDNWASKIAKIIPKHSTILGWSIGGIVAIKIAHIIAIHKVIICASTPKFVTSADWKFGVENSNFKAFTENTNVNVVKSLTRFISLQGVEKSVFKHLKEIIKTNPPTSAGLCNALDILLTTDVRNELLAIKNIEVFLGEKDTIVPIKIKKWYLDNNIKTTVVEGGHIPFLSKHFYI